MIHINNFIDKIKFFESRNSKDFIIPMADAKNLHADITKLLLVLQEINHSKKKDNISESENVDGGEW
ncbi:MAG: hypothetical protein HOK52_10080 [Candidatus Marinimicrobia bacterium]|jgi:hypothetical protein|nr:hypothetical protein [Candidatus Neomarinimicrobiota bacterium]